MIYTPKDYEPEKYKGIEEVKNEIEQRWQNQEPEKRQNGKFQNNKRAMNK